MTHAETHHREPLDDVDRRIVAELSVDGRLSVRTLAERVHISRTAAHNRLQRLIERGVVRGFGAQIERCALGLHVVALVTVKVANAEWAAVAERLAQLPFVEKVQAVAGEVDLIVTISAPNHERLSQAILRDVQGVPGVAATRSHQLIGEFEGQPPACSLDTWSR